MVTVILIIIGALGTGRLGNTRTIVDHPDYWMINIGQNTDKSVGDLTRLAVFQTPVKKKNTG